MPVVCVHVPAYKLAVTAPAAEGVVLVADRLERGRIVDRSLSAAALGVEIGMTLAQGQACANEARTVVDDPARDQQVWGEILDALDAASPLVEDAAEGTAYVEMRGIAGTPAHWLAAVRAALGAFTLPFRLALGPNPFVARAAALAADGTIWLDDVAERLAPLPLGTLEIEAGDRERLRLLGITTLGGLAALPAGPFVRRFGPAAAAWHARACGVDERPLRPRPRRLHVERRLFGEGSAACEEQLLFALRTLVAQVVDDLTLAGKRAGALGLELECEDGDLVPVAIRAAQPTAHPATLFELVRARLEGLTLRAPVVGLRLRAESLEDDGVALSLFAGDDPDPETLGLVLARLDAAFGDGTAQRVEVADGARPETRSRYHRFTLDAVAPPSPLRSPPRALPVVPAVQYRPFPEPRDVDVRLQQGAPALVGTPPQAVIDVAGPWRVDEGWWEPKLGIGTALRRDDYDVLLEDGALYRLAHVENRWLVCGRYD